MPKNSLAKKSPISEKRRDFIEEYNEILKIVGRDINSIEYEWKREGDHIKKLTMFDMRETSILTNNTSDI